jgi:hypothetical protein
MIQIVMGQIGFVMPVDMERRRNKQRVAFFYSSFSF